VFQIEVFHHVRCIATPLCCTEPQEKEEKEKKMLVTAKAQGENPKAKVVKSGADDKEGQPILRSALSPCWEMTIKAVTHEAMSWYTDIPCEHNSKSGLCGCALFECKNSPLRGRWYFYVEGSVVRRDTEDEHPKR
jgi:hypothetical protein